jgi:hypothetical protein
MCCHAVDGCFAHAVVKRASTVALTAIKNLVNAKIALDARESTNMFAAGN